jgi:hypothetical protein
VAFTKGKPMMIQRTGYPDDVKYVGNTREEQLRDFVAKAEN